MSFRDTLRDWFGVPEFPDPPVQARHGEPLAITELAAAVLGGGRSKPWTPATIEEALGVPSIQRCVTLIANTASTLTVQVFQDSMLMPETPRLVARPNPYSLPVVFYRDTFWAMATRGEFVWFIASRGTDRRPTALVNVPLHELSVEENTRDRLRPLVRWGNKDVSTWWMPADQTGDYIHGTYAKRHPFALRGVGPMQMCGAAISVSVEAQEWAANFFADGGHASTIVKAAGSLAADDDEDATYENEARNLLEQFTAGKSNMTKVIDDAIEEVTFHEPSVAGAQMLAARDYQDGDAARMFGIDGAFLEHSSSGSSLRYTNQESEFTKFVRTCLAPNYLELVEQTLTDLLPRNQVARFDVDGFQRSDTKTRFETYKIGIESGVIDAEFAQRKEGILPGSTEVAPVPFSAPVAVPSAALIPTRDSVPFGSAFVGRSAAAVREFRCDGMTTKRRGGVPRLEPCNALLSKDGAFTGTCRRCKKDYAAVA